MYDTCEFIFIQYLMTYRITSERMEHKVPIQGNYNEIIIHKTGFDELNIKKINKYFYQIWIIKLEECQKDRHKCNFEKLLIYQLLLDH